MRVLALGSCRVHDPLIAAEEGGGVEYLNRGFRRRTLYLHEVHEAIQFVRHVRREISVPREILPFAYMGGLRLHGRMTLLIQQAGHVVVENCTDKHYEVGGWTLNINEIIRQIVEPAGDAAKEWWAVAHNGGRPDAALVEKVEAELRATWWGRWRFGEGHRRVLRELSFRLLSAEEIAQGFARLQALLGKPLLIVPHAAVRLADGTPLAERLEHVDKTMEAARIAGLPLLDPRTFIERDGQGRAFVEDGTDFNHYAADYVPVVGREIVAALRR